MAYQPPEGWVQVTRNPSTGEVHSQRLHGDRDCAERAVAARLDRAREKGSDKMTYAQARRLRKFSVCKCTGQRPSAYTVNEAQTLPQSASTPARIRPPSLIRTTPTLRALLA